MQPFRSFQANGSRIFRGICFVGALSLFAGFVLAPLGSSHSSASGTIPAEDADSGEDILWRSKRAGMITAIKEDVVDTAQYIGKRALDSRVLKAMALVPRHQFVPEDVRQFAYLNRPLRIGYGQTISQPYIVALMTDILEPEPDDVVLEVGTGSGYQAAVLAELVATVYSIEIVKPLAEQARERLQRLGYHNVNTKFADGFFGWDTKAPFDSIIVTAASGQIPPPLIAQLKPGGRMIIPVGDRFSVQYLMLLEKDRNSRVTSRQILPVRFVPLTGSH